MKRYLVFVGITYYPLGGMEDFVNDFDNLEEAKECLENHKLYIEEYPRNEELVWSHIYDCETKEFHIMEDLETKIYKIEFKNNYYE